MYLEACAVLKSLIAVVLPLGPEYFVAANALAFAIALSVEEEAIATGLEDVELDDLKILEEDREGDEKELGELLLLLKELLLKELPEELWKELPPLPLASAIDAIKKMEQTRYVKNLRISTPSIGFED